MDVLDDFKKVKHLANLYMELDYYNSQFDRVLREIRSYAVNMSPRDIKYAIKLSEKVR